MFGSLKSSAKVAATGKETEDKETVRKLSLQRLQKAKSFALKQQVSMASVVRDVIKDFEEERLTFRSVSKTTLLNSADAVNIGGVHIEGTNNIVHLLLFCTKSFFLILPLFHLSFHLSDSDWKETGWAVAIVILYYLAFFWAFFYFVYSLTLTGSSTTYLSLQGNSKVQTCDEIPITVTTTIYGDVYGRWSSDPLFLNNASIFALEFAGTNITTEQYTATMTSFKNQLKTLGAKAANRDVGWNSVMWSAFEFHDVKTGMTFYSIADPAYLYKSYVLMGLLTSAADGACINPFQLANWDVSGNYLSYISKVPAVSHAHTYAGGIPYNYTGWSADFGYGKLEYNYDYSTRGTCREESFVCGYTNNKLPLDFLGNEVIFNGSDYHTSGGSGCPNQFPYFNYQPHWQMPYQFTNVFENPFDIRTITSVIALNMNIGKLNTYQTVRSFADNWASGGLPGSFYYDPYFAGMEPFFCVDKIAVSKSGVVPMTKAQIDGPELCFLAQPGVSGKLLYYPTSLSFWQANDKNGTWHHCECPRDANEQSCNERAFFISLFYDLMPGGDLTAQVPLNSSVNMVNFALQVQRFLLDDPLNGDLKMQTFFFQFYGSAWQNAAPAYAPSTPYVSINNLGMPTDINPGNTTMRDWHLNEWRKICPWGTCGSFLFYLQNDDNHATTLPVHDNFYQFSDFPYINTTFTATSGTYYPNLNATWTPNNYTMEGLGYGNKFWNQTTQHRKNMMCANTLYNEDMMSAFVKTYPVSFIEPYFVCKKTVLSALSDAVGNAAGTAGLVAAFAMAIFGYIFRKVHSTQLLFPLVFSYIL